MGGRLWQDREALVGSVGSLGQAQHRHSGQFVDGIQRCLSIKQYLQGTNIVTAANFCTDAKTSESSMQKSSQMRQSPSGTFCKIFRH